LPSRAKDVPVNPGLPSQVDEETLFLTKVPLLEHELWGCIRWDDVFWLYRMFLTGRDDISRPGHYFFVIFKLEAPPLSEDSRITGIVERLRTQTAFSIKAGALRSLPGKTAGDALFPGVAMARFTNPNPTFVDVVKKCSIMQEGDHHGWIFRAGSLVREYSDLNPPLTSPKPPTPPKPNEIPPRPTPPPIPRPMREFVAYLAAGIGLLALVLGLVCFSARLKQVENQVRTLENRILQLEKDQKTIPIQIREELKELDQRLRYDIRDLESKHTKPAVASPVQTIQPKSRPPLGSGRSHTPD